MHWQIDVRVLVTGSRVWTDIETIRRALDDAVSGWPDWGGGPVLVHGGCNVSPDFTTKHTPPLGADAIAHDLWTSWGYRVEMYRAEWDRYGNGAGPIRNRQMVDRGADLCLGFVLDGSRGATNCIRLARQAGIPTHVYNAFTGRKGIMLT